MAVVDIADNGMEVFPLRSLDSQNLRGQNRWQFVRYPQATSLYRFNGEFRKITSGTSGDHTQIQINNQDSLPDHVWVMMTCGLTIKVESAVQMVEAVAYSASPHKFGEFLPYQLTQFDSGGADWPDNGNGDALTRFYYFELEGVNVARATPIDGADMNTYLPRFSWKNSSGWSTGHEFNYSIDLSFVGFPRSMSGSGSLYVPQIYP